MSMATLIRLYHTLKYLKSIQIYYRLYYILRDRWRRLSGFAYALSVPSKVSSLELLPSINSAVAVSGRTMRFLNVTHTFENDMNWNLSKYGKLWTYNVNYFDFLHQHDMSKEEGLRLVYDFVEQSAHLNDGLEPFPISLRGINWIKFLTYFQIDDQKINNSLYAQYQILIDNLEYHLLGNHLLENGFSLLFGAYYFQDRNLHVKAKALLFQELQEQILDDGAHFELSPMYHQIMLFRLLDCINLLQNNPKEQDRDLLEFLRQQASAMLGWLKAITFQDGSIPLFNDSANSIAPASSELFAYAATLNLHVKERVLKRSGYRKFSNEYYECIVDVGNIGPDYIPGHAHADTFGFELHANGKPFIVDTGISTYETGARRREERATAAHNTVELNGCNQSEVWGAFRVAERAGITSLIEKDDTVVAIHDGYKKQYRALHQRKFIFHEKKMTIVDTILSDRSQQAVARLHFHPSVTGDDIKKHIRLAQESESVLKEYAYAPEFNMHVKAKVLEIPFATKLEMSIEL